MYWPCGVPRIYAYNGSNEDEHSENGNDVEPEAETTNGGEINDNHVSHSGGSDIIDLRVARLEHIFATISKSSLAIWSSRVGVEPAI